MSAVSVNSLYFICTNQGHVFTFLWTLSGQRFDRIKLHVAGRAVYCVTQLAEKWIPVLRYSDWLQLEDRGSGVRFPGRWYFSLFHRIQTGFGSHPASYPRGTGGSFPGGKAAEAWSRPFTSI